MTSGLLGLHIQDGDVVPALGEGGGEKHRGGGLPRASFGLDDGDDMRHKPRLKRGVIKTWERPVRTCTPMRMPARGA